MEKEKGSILLEGIIQHMETGIIVIEDGGKIEVVNDAALQTLGVNRLEHLDELDVIQNGLSARLSKIRYESGNVLTLKRKGLAVAHVLARVSLLKLEERTLKIISIQDIGSQLEANEIESWQKMTRVLSHEISNSVTPISTLGDGIQMKLKQGRTDKEGRLILENGAARDLLQSSELIQQRSNALVEFMEHYKNFSRLPDPVPGKMFVSEFFEGLELLFKEDLNKAGIRMEIAADDPSVGIMGDQKLLEQAFINLVRNSMEALKDKNGGQIKITAGQPDNRRVSLGILDNGPGIPEEILPQVFTPFFTTKPGGTGIGLTLVRKIVVMSGGSISIDSEPGRGTRVKLRLPLYMDYRKS
ncbi:MAG: ATP-binding protein [Bacteroidota bacterium]|nr:ATP-binding protein [Bacteroidota bacterium]